MASLNKVILLGNLTRDPQLSYLPSQTAVAEFGLAINRKFKGQDGQFKDDTCFVDLRAFGKTAEIINQYVGKGDPLLVEGRLQYDSWTAQDGSKKSKLRVTVENVQLLAKPKGAGESRPQEQQDEQPLNDDIPF